MEIKTLNGSIKLNESLLKKQKVSKSNINKLKKLYYEQSVIFDKMQKENDTIRLRSLNKENTKVEYQIQSLWNFKKNRSMHKWFLVPKCLCPKSDNFDRLGTKFGIISDDCPIHSNNSSFLKKDKIKRRMKHLFK